MPCLRPASASLIKQQQTGAEGGFGLATGLGSYAAGGLDEIYDILDEQKGSFWP